MEYRDSHSVTAAREDSGYVSGSNSSVSAMATSSGLVPTRRTPLPRSPWSSHGKSLVTTGIPRWRASRIT